MKMSFFVSALFVTSAALAHVEPGLYQGSTADKQTCSMTAGKTYFENNRPHPLNERVELTVNGELFLVGHPSIIDAEKGEVSFNHDFFHGVLPTTTGAKALVVAMEHSQSFEGPKSFKWIESKWRTGENTVIECLDLKHSASAN